MMALAAQTIQIIPYQELLGNYDAGYALDISTEIIPYQELLGNYDCLRYPEQQR